MDFDYESDLEFRMSGYEYEGNLDEDGQWIFMWIFCF